MLHNNSEYSIEILNHSLNHNINFIFASSASVYGHGEKGFIDSKDCEIPLNTYADSKFKVDRVIKKLEDFDRFNGEKVKIKTRSAIVDRKNFSGILRGIRGNNILLEFEESIVEIDHDNLDRARLDPVL